ncbi:MAG: AI-2E family transporter, partial [Bacteroidaceae bacterium]
MKKAITFDSFIRTSAIIIGIVLLIKTIDYLSAVLVPFFVAWFIAYLIFPIVEFFQYKLRFHYRILAILAAMLSICGVAALLIWFTIPPVVEDFNRFL